MSCIISKRLLFNFVLRNIYYTKLEVDCSKFFRNVNNRYRKKEFYNSPNYLNLELLLLIWKISQYLNLLSYCLLFTHHFYSHFLFSNHNTSVRVYLFVVSMLFYLIYPQV